MFLAWFFKIKGHVFFKKILPAEKKKAAVLLVKCHITNWPPPLTFHEPPCPKGLRVQPLWQTFASIPIGCKGSFLGDTHPWSNSLFRLLNKPFNCQNGKKTFKNTFASCPCCVSLQRTDGDKAGWPLYLCTNVHRLLLFWRWRTSLSIESPGSQFFDSNFAFCWGVGVEWPILQPYNGLSLTLPKPLYCASTDFSCNSFLNFEK